MTAPTPSANPLFLLRDFTVHNKPVTLLASDGSVVTEIARAETVVFNGASFARTTLTNLKKSGTVAEFYTLDSLIFLLQHNHLDYSALTKEAVASNIQLVSPIDRKGIIDYLTGHAETNSNIVQQVPARDKRPLDDLPETTRDDGNAKKTKLAPASAKHDDIEIVKRITARERLIKTKSSILRGNKVCADGRRSGGRRGQSKFDGLRLTARRENLHLNFLQSFTHLIKLADDLVLKKTQTTTTIKGKERPTGAAATSSSAAKTAAGKHQSSSGVRPARPLSREARIPIIIVPAAATAMLTLYNIKQFLEDQTFVDQEAARVNGIKKPTRVTIEHKKSNGQVVPYHVVDSVKDFKKEDWWVDRVICVFCTGVKWQFDDWIWRDPIQIFNNGMWVGCGVGSVARSVLALYVELICFMIAVKGIYAKWHDVKINEAVNKWNVIALDIHRHKRHTDGSTVSRFWDMLEGYISQRKPYLAY
ncbi:RNA pol II accessory factor, Cdc73 family-domain-containing protein [Jimgerdemannia flammicorona]|uniref:RNA pol II accessory factor, Cdc73 family-domain-containing protein n=1 Tax=Jimgerdemannia flammicorona TaxID=994334 RepID=A0A433QMT7_9FUNG|nr:RNA pol II accessory factor, Cdc73 family-domain-containing protein [Jimgerdemannia flammicorona]